MSKLRNLLNPGELVVPIPIGVIMTLQYNREGNLEKVFTGLKDDRIDVTKTKLVDFVNNRTVPTKIHILNGTTFVEGVLYTGDIQTKKSWEDQGTLNEILFAKYSKNPEMFNFFGMNIFSEAINIVGAASSTLYLKTCGFNTLNGFLLPVGDTDALVSTFVNGDLYPFLKVAFGFFVFGREEKYVDGCLNQHIVHKVTKFTDINGYIKAEITFKESSLFVDYSDIVKYRISRNTTIIADSDGVIVFCFGGNGNPASTISCDCCGKLIVVPESGLVQCTDAHCPSTLYPAITQFIHKLSLFQMEQDKFEEHLESRDIFCISDLFGLDEYKDVKIHTTIGKLLRALIPFKLIPNDEIIEIFVNRCLNSADTVKYYADNPDRIGTDLNIQHRDLNRLVCWLSDGYNVTDLKTLLISSNIIYDDVDRSFDGPPIFRGKKIYLTGKFIHGSIIDVCMILQSYAATVTTAFSIDVDCVIVGGMNEDTDGSSIFIAEQQHIPIFEELEFFKQYDIDADIEQFGSGAV